MAFLGKSGILSLNHHHCGFLVKCKVRGQLNALSGPCNVSNGNGNATGSSSESLRTTEQRVAKLMEEDMGSAMQYLQGKGLCLMPISLATAMSSSSNHSRGALFSPNSNAVAAQEANVAGAAPEASSTMDDVSASKAWSIGSLNCFFIFSVLSRSVKH